MHLPVLLHEVIEYLNPQPGKLYVDGTIGGGGHAREILKRIVPDGMFLGIDWDERMIRKLETDELGGKNIFLVSGNYADLPEILKKLRRPPDITSGKVGVPTKASGLPKADGLVIDLGFSSEQLENSGRGFSFLKDEPLIMTYSDDARPVRELVRNMDERTLADILREFGEERFAKRIAHAIAAHEKQKRILTTGELVNIIVGAVPKFYERGRIHPATRTFQALRIYANDELGNLRQILSVLPDILATRGRVCIVSFHSLEDRIVKNAFKEMEQQHILRIITKKPICASPEEVKQNSRSRSAKLRVAELM